MWEAVADGRWERTDGYAFVTVRETADGRWAVTLDRLEQAADGPAYRRVTLDDRQAARERAAVFREHNPVPD